MSAQNTSKTLALLSTLPSSTTRPRLGKNIKKLSSLSQNLKRASHKKGLLQASIAPQDSHTRENKKTITFSNLNLIWQQGFTFSGVFGINSRSIANFSPNKGYVP
jgi:hypothetical protein